MSIVMSYSRADEVTVKVLARGFQAARREVWFDHDIRGGDVWWDEILSNIRRSSVFLFALSDHSLKSQACLAELAYATALHRPILPVVVGPVSTEHSNILAGRQHVAFRPDDTTTAMEVLAEADRAAARQVPLPEPLPKEPPIPFAYLGEVRQQIDGGNLDPETQLVVIERLRRSLGEEKDASARRDILAMLRTLRDCQWRTWQAELEITALLGAYEKMTGGAWGDAARGSTRAGAPTVPIERPGADATPGPPPAWSDHDAREAFLKRSEEMFAELRASRAGQEARRPGSTGPAVGPELFAGVAPDPGAPAVPPTGPTRSPAADAPLATRYFLGIGRGFTTGEPAADTRPGPDPAGDTVVVPQREAPPDPPPAFTTSIGATATGPQATGPQATGPQATDREAPGREATDPEATGSEATGSEATGSEATGAGATGSETAATMSAPVPTRKGIGIAALVLSGVFALLAAGRQPAAVTFALPAVFAVVALGFSAQVTRRAAAGRAAAARTASRTALVWSVVAIVLAVAALVVILQSAPLP